MEGICPPASGLLRLLSPGCLAGQLPEAGPLSPLVSTLQPGEASRLAAQPPRRARPGQLRAAAQSPGPGVRGPPAALPLVH